MTGQSTRLKAAELKATEFGGTELRAVMRRHPRAGDALVAALLAVLCAVILTGRTGATTTAASPLTWVMLVVVPLPLIWRRRAPVVVLWACVALFWLTVALDASAPAGVFVPLAALHAVARYRPARQVVPGMFFIVPPALSGRVEGTHGWAAFAMVASITVTITLVGVNQRTRQAYLESLEERARHLELEQEQRARLAVADERTRIAREMHDVVAHHLAVITALSEGAAATIPRDPERAVSVLAQAAATGREALAEMRRILGLLRSGPLIPVGGPSFSTAGAVDHPAAAAADVLAPQPGFDDIGDLVDGVRAAGLRTALIREGTPGRWGPGIGLATYRIVQEALTNTLKHAGPRATAEVRLTFAGAGLDIEVRDDGGSTGLPARPSSAARSTGHGLSAGPHGLAGMRERAGAYGGRVVAQPGPGGTGWLVRACLRSSTPASAPNTAAPATGGTPCSATDAAPTMRAAPTTPGAPTTPPAPTATVMAASPALGAAPTAVDAFSSEVS